MTLYVKLTSTKHIVNQKKTPVILQEHGHTPTAGQNRVLAISLVHKILVLKMNRKIPL